VMSSSVVGLVVVTVLMSVLYISSGRNPASYESCGSSLFYRTLQGVGLHLLASGSFLK